MPERTPEEEETLALMAEIWAEYKGEHLERLTVLEEAVGCLRVGALPEDLRLKAKQEAHKLAGSVGTFGFVEASRLAREIEHLLEAGPSGDQAKTAALQNLVASLREQLEAACKED